MYVYKITMTNGKEYVVKSNLGNIVEFAKRCTEVNNICDFVLNESYEEKGMKYNSILIRADHVSSIEYSIDLK